MYIGQGEMFAFLQGHMVVVVEGGSLNCLTIAMPSSAASLSDLDLLLTPFGSPTDTLMVVTMQVTIMEVKEEVTPST